MQPRLAPFSHTANPSSNTANQPISNPQNQEAPTVEPPLAVLSGASWH